MACRKNVLEAMSLLKPGKRVLLDGCDLLDNILRRMKINEALVDPAEGQSFSYECLCVPLKRTSVKVPASCYHMHVILSHFVRGM